MNILKLKSVSNVATERVLRSWGNGKFLCLALFDKYDKESERIWLDEKEQEKLLFFLVDRLDEKNKRHLLGRLETELFGYPVEPE